ncbi:hypothetical protein C8R45DRAFT_925006 [Mycena sanguinolenta]|nr:hypothetical protein C8R45DRAFT_925006 [Mycena sanguinolenta]
MTEFMSTHLFHLRVKLNTINTLIADAEQTTYLEYSHSCNQQEARTVWTWWFKIKRGRVTASHSLLAQQLSLAIGRFVLWSLITSGVALSRGYRRILVAELEDDIVRTRL